MLFGAVMNVNPGESAALFWWDRTYAVILWTHRVGILDGHVVQRRTHDGIQSGNDRERREHSLDLMRVGAMPWYKKLPASRSVDRWYTERSPFPTCATSDSSCPPLS